MTAKNAKITICLTESDRAAFLRAARLKGKSMQSVLAAYTAAFEKRARRDLEIGKIEF